MLVTLSGIEIDVNPEQFSNAEFPNVLIALGKVIELSDEQPEKL